MSLSEKLDRFKKQQEKCQSTLTSIAAKAGAVRNPSKPVPLNAPPANARAPVPVKFSDDTERLQHINSIRKAPVGAQMKRVIDLLFEVCSQWQIIFYLVILDLSAIQKNFYSIVF